MIRLYARTKGSSELAMLELDPELAPEQITIEDGRTLAASMLGQALASPVLAVIAGGPAAPAAPNIPPGSA